MIETLTIEAELPGLEAEICAVNAKAMELRAHDPQAALDWLNQSEHLVESVSITRQGRFHNQRALALKDLGEYDRAILEFDRAAYCFQESGETELQGMVHNNIARAYSLSGNYERAHESVDRAIGLATDRKYLIQWSDQKAICFIDEGKLDEAEAQIDKVLALFVGIEDIDLFAECLSTKNRIAQQKHGSCGKIEKVIKHTSDNLFPVTPPPTQRGDAMPLECAKTILSQSYQSALPLITLIAMIADPDGDPARYSAAWAVMQFAFTYTPRGEDELRRFIDEVLQKPQEVGDISS